MKSSDVFKSKYLKGDQIGDRKVVVAIQRIEMEEVGRKKEQLPVLYFTGKDLGMVCNRTNWRTLTTMLGEETDDWIGQRITLYTAPVEFEGETTMALRIMPKKPTPPGAKAVAPVNAAPAQEPSDNDTDPDLAPDDANF